MRKILSRLGLSRLGLTLTLALLSLSRYASASSEVTMMVNPADASRPVLEGLRDEFNGAHPEIKFRIIWTDLSAKMHLLTAARSLPDLISLPDFEIVNYGGELLDLDEHWRTDRDATQQIYPQLVQSCRFGGHLKMLPAFYNLPLLYYRPDLFRQAGIPYPDGRWTWREYRAAAKQLTRRGSDGEVQTWGTSLTQGWWVEWLSMLRQAGGEFMDDRGKVMIGRPATETAIGFLHDLLYQDHSAPLPTEQPAGGFMSGKYAMHYGGHVLEWFTLRQSANFEWDIAPLPAGPAGRATGEFAVAGWGIWKDSRNKAAAWHVLSFLSGKTAGLAFCRAGLPPVRRDVARLEFLKGRAGQRLLPPQHREALLESLQFARSVPKQKDFMPLAIGYVEPVIDAALANPDRAAVRGINLRLERDCQGYLATLGAKPPVSPLWFLVELGTICSILAACRPALLKLNRGGPVRGTTVETEKHFFAFTAVWFLGMLAFFVGPMLTSFYWSHTEYNIVEPARFVGLAQYHALFAADPYFWHSLRITFLYAALAVPLSLMAGLGAALLLNQKLPGMGYFRTLFYLPSILPVTASGIMWAFLLNPRWGLLNRALALVGVKGPGWLYDPHWALISLVLVSLWGFGGSMLIFLAGLKNIPEPLYEAASIDGAGTMTRFFRITVPLLSPIIFFNLTVGIIGALQIFDIAYVVGSVGPGIGEPQKSTYFYVLSMFEKSFLELQLGLGSAMAWVLFALVLAMTLLNFWGRQYWVFEGSD